MTSDPRGWQTLLKRKYRLHIVANTDELAKHRRPLTIANRYYITYIDWAYQEEAAVKTPDRIILVQWLKQYFFSENCKAVTLSAYNPVVIWCHINKIKLN